MHQIQITTSRAWDSDEEGEISDSDNSMLDVSDDVRSAHMPAESDRYETVNEVLIILTSLICYHKGCRAGE